MLRIAASITQRLRLPTVCLLCKQYHGHHEPVCKDCLSLFQPIKYRCRYCACPLPEADFLICGTCCITPPAFDQALIAYRYEEPLRTLIHQFKYQEKLYLASFLASLMLKAFDDRDEKPQCLLPVPMHPERLKERGFNQSALLTKALARKLRIRHHLQQCQKIINTKPQASLDKKQRASNLRGAFKAAPLAYKHLALVDDIFTTGSTANELAKTLKQRGVERVDVWCCARAVLD